MPLSEPVNEKASAAAEELDSFFSAWSWQQWLLLILCALVLLILIYIGVRLIAHKIKVQRMVGTLREDLLLRRELAAMAAGKDRKSQEKEQFMRTEAIRMDVALAHDTMKAQGITHHSTNTWLLLGEPGSGKSRLMESGGLEFPAGLNDFSRASEATSTLNLWLTSKGTVWDIGGRLFLSRWGGRQDNEWLFFLQEYRKVYRNSLPNGIILTIPADALLLDTPDLRDRKIVLIAEELRAIAHEIGVFCPIWLVVTKCDQIEGFSEFFSLISDEDCDKVLGWENSMTDKTFDQTAFDSDFDRLCAKLLHLRDSTALNESIWKRTEQGEKRADIVTLIYLFAEKFASVKESLGRYAAGIFAHVRSKDNARGLFLFEGCWFTAVLDKPVITTERLIIESSSEGVKTSVLSDEHSSSALSAAEGKLDTTGVVSVREKIVSVASERHYFSSHLLMETIMGALNHSDYTDAAVARIRKPYRRASLVLLALASPLAVWSYLAKPSLVKLAYEDTEFWGMTERLFADGVINHSPLIDLDKGEQVPQINEPLGGIQLSRRKYLDVLRNRTSLSAHLPLFWQPAAWLIDNEFSGRLLKTDKDYIGKAAVVAMLLKPTVDTSRGILEGRAERDGEEHQPWTTADTQMFSTLFNVTYYGVLLMQGHDVVDDIDYSVLIRLDKVPSIDSALKSLWMSTVASNQTLTRMTALNGYLSPVSMEAASALDKGSALYMEALERMDIYPDLQYATLCRMLDDLQKLQVLKSQMRDCENSFADAVTRNDYSSMRENIAAWNSMAIDAETIAARLFSAEKQLGITNQTSLRSCAKELQQALRDRLAEDARRFHSMQLELEDSANARFIFSMVARLEKAINAAYERLDRDLLLITDELCLFWDTSAGTAAGVRPWHSFMNYVRELNGLISYPIPVGTREQAFQQRILQVQQAKRQYDARVESLLKNQSNAFDAECWNRNWKILQGNAVLTWLSEAPSNSSELMNSFKPRKMLKLPVMPFTHSENAEPPYVFAPQEADRTIRDLVALTDYIHENFNADAGQHDADILAQTHPLEEAIDAYVDAYVSYWTEQVTAKYKIRGIRTWAQFVESADMLRNCDVASILQDINRYMLFALNIPSLSDEKRYPLAAARRERIEQAQKDLTSDVARRFIISSEFISKMDADPVRAWYELTAMSDEEIFANYWAAWYPHTDQNTFLWWNNYLELGMFLLRDEASRTLRGGVQGCLSSATMFPLCNNSLRDGTSTLPLYAIEDLSDRLLILGNKVDEEKAKKVEAQAKNLNIPLALADLHLPLVRSRVKAWERIGEVIDLLSNPELPLSFELLLPPAEVCVAHNDGEKGKARVIPVGRRFPYCRVVSSGRIIADTFRMNSNGAQEVVLSSRPMPADLGDLQFQFFQYSGSTTPDSVMKLPGEWSAINLYLRTGVKLADDQKTAYVPVTFRDKEGYTCQFWIGLRFNKPMIAPSSWPGSEVFEDASIKTASDLPEAEKKLRKLLRTTFLTPQGRPRDPSEDERRKLAQNISNLLLGKYSLAFEVVTPSKLDQPEEARITAAALFPYFAMGDEESGTSKMMAMPDITTSAQTLVGGWEALNIRLYRHASDTYPASYVNLNKLVQSYAVEKASAYSPLQGYLTVPVSCSTEQGNVIYFLYLRPTLLNAPDDGLFPSEAKAHPLISYPDAAPVDTPSSPLGDDTLLELPLDN